jgi:hypothetical protein
MTFDAKGLPGVSVVTTEFREAVAAQTRALGFDPAIVYVPHPIQNRTTTELQALADAAIEPLLAKLVTQ